MRRSSSLILQIVRRANDSVVRYRVMNRRSMVPKSGKIVSFKGDSCFVCGKSNTIGLHLDFEYDSENITAKSSVVFGEEHQGWDDVIHGGILTAALDDVMAHSLFTTGNMAITTNIEVKFLKAVKVGERCLIEGRAVKIGRKMANVEGVLYVEDDGDRVIKCESKGTYYLDPSVD